MPNFDDDAARRIARVVRKTELAPGGGRAPRADGPRPTDPTRVFWTTSAIGSASKTGTTVSTAKRTLGSGTARMCILDSSGNDIPDVSKSDVTIYNPVVMTGSVTQINTGLFVECVHKFGKWRIINVERCPT